ncbi:MAG: hypothetical protein IPL16_13065 [Ignavibacteria bacterium]|nr:hypothetical protein [Ignavibacteria bacterium]
MTSPSGTGSAQTVSHTLTSVVNIAANSRFYVGIRQNSSTNVGFGFQNEIPVRSKSFFYSYPDTSNTWTDFSAAGANYKLDIAPMTGGKVIVTSSTGTTFARYTSLDLALAQVGVLHTGAIKVLINESHTLTTSATIGNSNFTSCKIFPTAAVTLTANALAGNVILLNGADNVTIDGRLNGVDVIGNGNSLSITSTNVGSGVRVVQVQNGSQNFTIRNVNITIPSPVTAATYGRCVNIAQSTATAQGGQDNATVKYCNLSGGDRTLQTFGSSNVSPGPGIVANYNTVIFGNKVKMLLRSVSFLVLT